MKPRALVVEASPARRRLLEAVLALEGFDVQAQAEAGETRGDPPDLVVLGSCLSDPFFLCSGIKERDRLVPVLMVVEGEEGRLRGWEVGADEVLLRPLRRRELASRARALIRLRRLYEGLVEGEKVLLTLAEAVEAHDPYARGHTRKARPPPWPWGRGPASLPKTSGSCGWGPSSMMQARWAWTGPSS